MIWQDLSDDELEQRLVERGMPSQHATAAVMRRDDADVEQFIDNFWEANDG